MRTGMRAKMTDERAADLFFELMKHVKKGPVLVTYNKVKNTIAARSVAAELRYLQGRLVSDAACVAGLLG